MLLGKAFQVLKVGYKVKYWQQVESNMLNKINVKYGKLLEEISHLAFFCGLIF